MKGEVDKLGINKMVKIISNNLKTSLNKSKTKVGDLDLGKLKTFPIDLKKLSDVVNYQIVENTKLLTIKDKSK